MSGFGRRLLLVVTVGLAMAGWAGTGHAQPAEDPPGEAEQPSYLVTAVATCGAGGAGVDVRVMEDQQEPFQVTLSRISPDTWTATRPTAFDEDRFLHAVSFAGVAVGEYTVEVEGARGPADGLPVSVRACDDLGPGDDALTVEVECRGGWGIVTFQVANPGGEVREYTLTLNDLSSEYRIELGGGEFLRITENTFDDNTYRATLTVDGQTVTEEFTVACAEGNPPAVSVLSACDVQEDQGGPAPVRVAVRNPNRGPVTYQVTLAVRGAPARTESVGVGGGEVGTVVFPAVPAGDHPVTVTGDRAETGAVVSVDDCSDVRPDQDGLQVTSRCAGQTSVITFRFFRPEQTPATQTFAVDGTDRFNRTVTHRGEEPYQWVRYAGELADGTYTARLTGGGRETVERFSVECDGVAPTTSTGPTTEPSTPTTPSVPATTTPAPQGRGGGGLASTGAAIGGLVGLGALVLITGCALLLLVSRRRARQD